MNLCDLWTCTFQNLFLFSLYDEGKKILKIEKKKKKKKKKKDQVLLKICIHLKMEMGLHLQQIVHFANEKKIKKI